MPRTIGLMSGTSLDGVDAAWIDTDGERVHAFGPSLTIPYDDTLRRDLRRILELAPGLAASGAGAADPLLASAVARLTEAHVKAVRSLDREADLIGFHGQTILHQPDLGRTWQVGDAALLARETGLPVAYDFRSADMAAGGEGAPLAPVYHAALAHGPLAHSQGMRMPLAVLNVGGVANVTWIGAAEGELLAFDTGPGNGPLDDWVARHTGQAFDRDGALALSGTVDQAVLASLMGHAYFARPAPKSLDRLDFSRSIAASGLSSLSPADGAATLVAFTVAAIAAPVRMGLFPAPPLHWLVTGGGRRNPAIMAALRAELGVPVEPVESVGWDGDALEAQCFGFLAARVSAGLPLSFPGTTGVAAAARGGHIVTFQ